MPTRGNQLKAIITGDISDLKAKLTQADALLDNYRAQIRKLNADISRQSNETKQAEQQLERLNNSFKRGAVSVSEYENQQDKLNARIRDSKTRTSILKGELRKLHRETIDVEKGMENLSASTSDYANASRRTQQATQKTGKAINNFGNTTRGNAVPAMQSFSQIIQDSPYGIQGVANNIQQLTAQFGYLSTQSGGASSAIKAMIGSLTGPAGILLAMSAVTTVFVSYGDEILDFINSVGNAERANRDFAKSFSETRASTQSEIIQLRTLIEIAGDETETREKRNQAVKILQDEYPTYLKNLNTENTTSKEIAESINSITTALENKARVQAAEQLITKEAQKLFEAQVKAEKNYQKSLEHIPKRLARIQQGYESYSMGVQKSSFDRQKAEENLENKAAKRRDESISEAEKDYEDFSNKLKNIIKDIPNLLDVLGDGLSEGIDPVEVEIVPIIGGIDLELANLREREFELRKLTEFTEKLEELYTGIGEPSSGLDDPFGGLTAEIAAAENEIIRFEELVEELQKTLGEGFTGAGFNNEQLEAMQEQIRKTAETAKLVSNIVEQSINQLTSSLLQGEASFKSFAQFFTQMILGIVTKALAGSLANAILGASQFAVSTGPAAPFVLGGTIGSTVGLIRGAFSEIPAFAEGGIVPGGSFNGDKIPAFVNSGEMILNMGQQRELFNFLDGRMGSLQGNARELKIQIEGITRGEDIYWSQQRYTTNRSRRG